MALLLRVLHPYRATTRDPPLTRQTLRSSRTLQVKRQSSPFSARMGHSLSCLQGATTYGDRGRGARPSSCPPAPAAAPAAPATPSASCTVVRSREAFSMREGREDSETTTFAGGAERRSATAPSVELPGTPRGKTSRDAGDFQRRPGTAVGTAF